MLFIKWGSRWWDGSDFVEVINSAMVYGSMMGADRDLTKARKKYPDSKLELVPLTDAELSLMTSLTTRPTRTKN